MSNDPPLIDREEIEEQDVGAAHAAGVVPDRDRNRDGPAASGHASSSSSGLRLRSSVHVDVARAEVEGVHVQLGEVTMDAEGLERAIGTCRHAIDVAGQKFSEDTKLAADTCRHAVDVAGQKFSEGTKLAADTCRHAVDVCNHALRIFWRIALSMILAFAFVVVMIMIIIMASMGSAIPSLALWHFPDTPPS
eukprot:tig00021339_g20436.t1